MRIRDLAQARVSYSYRRLHVLLQWEVWSVNHRQIYRLCSRGADAEDQETEMD